VWILNHSDQSVRYSAYRLAVLRIAVALLLLLLFATLPLSSAALFPGLQQEWLELPRALRGGLRLAAFASALWLLTGYWRKVAALFALLPIAAFVAFGQMDLRAGGSALLLLVALGTYPGADQWLPQFRVRASEELPTPASIVALGRWYRVALLLASVGLFLLPAWDGAPGTPWLLGVGSLLLLRVLLRGPIASTLLAAFAVAAVALLTTHGTLSLLPGWALLVFLAFDERWLPPSAPPEAIMFFDGVCSLCNESVRLIMDEEQRPLLRFAPLQGETAQQLLASRNTAQLDSMVFFAEGQTYERSQAALLAARAMGGFWSLLWLFHWVPLSVRNGVYNWVAERRYRWFGKLDACPIPTKEQRARFLP
jgi:predicted DCC family thiol-disulfide oxidoreductase YuxK